MRDDESTLYPRFYGGPLDGEHTPQSQRERMVALRPEGCENGFYVLRENNRYEWRELSDAGHG